MKQSVVFFMLLMAAITSTASSRQSQSDSTFEAQRVKFDPTRDPAKDVAVAVAKCRSERKRILLDVGGEWCSWCHRLDKFLHENADLDRYLSEHFIVVKVNFSEKNKNEKFLSQYPAIDGYPHLFVLESDGTLLLSQSTGDFEKGKAYDPEKFMRFLRKWSTKD